MCGYTEDFQNIQCLFLWILLSLLLDLLGCALFVNKTTEKTNIMLRNKISFERFGLKKSREDQDQREVSVKNTDGHYPLLFCM